MKYKEPGSAKITRPRVSGVVQRERLFKLLDEGRKKPVIWISGPAGSGKTTLVASYLDNRGLPCLWYQADETDADGASFFYYLGMAARKAAPRNKKPLPLLTPEYVPGIATFAKRYFESLYNRLSSRHHLLVFDNYQEVPADSVTHEVLQHAISVLPEGVEIVIISRTDPLPAFARVRANNQLRTLTSDDLRFTESESREFVGMSSRKSIPDTVVSELHAKTQGWVAGLVLFLEMSSIGRIDAERIDRHPPEDIFHYFAGQLFDKTDRETRQFLLKTAFLPVMSLAGAGSVSGFPFAGRILTDLTRRNYFIIKRRDPEPGFQYHPLFREFLLARAYELFSPEEIAKLQKNAAAILEHSGHIEDAVPLYCSAKDWNCLIPLVLNNAQSLIGQGRNRLLREWIEKIPVEISNSNPWLIFWSGLCELSSKPPESRRLLEKALRLFETAGDETGTLLAWSVIVQSFLIEQHDFRPLDIWNDWIDERLKQGLTFASPEIEASVVAGMTGILSWRKPARPDKDVWLERALSLPQKSSNFDACVRSYINSVIYHVWMGDFAQCNLLINALRTMIQARPVSPFRLIILKIAEAMSYNSSIDYRAQALQAVSEGLNIAQETGVFLMTPTLYLHGTVGALNDNDTARARELLQKAESLIGVDRRVHVSQYYLLCAWHDLAIGEVSRALVSARKSVNMIVEAGVPVAETLIRLALAHALSANGDQREAADELVRTHALATQTGSSYFDYLCNLTAAYFAFDGNDRSSGREALKRAMKKGQQKNFVTLSYFWRPDLMSRLCAEALEAGIEAEYARTLIRKLNLTPPESAGRIAQWPWRFDLATLGGFSLNVDGKPFSFPGKTQKKPLDLLKAIIALGGRDVAEHQLSEALWPDAEGDLARRSFDTTLHRLRKALGHEKAVTIDEGKLKLDPRLWQVDVWAFERLFMRAGELVKNADLAAAGKNEIKGREMETAAVFDKAIGLYKGHFLASDSDQPWTVSLRESLQNKFLRLVIMAGKYHEARGEWEQAKAYFQKGLDIDNLMEEFYQHLMICCGRLGQTAEVVSAYRKCRAVLSAAVGVEPSSKTEEIYATLMATPR